MKFSTCMLKETTKKELNTEFMFTLATARVDAVEILLLDFSPCEDRKVFARTHNQTIKMLRAQIQKGSVEFFVTKEGFEKSTTEAFYLINKFPELSSIVPSLSSNAIIARIKPLSVE